MRAIGVCNFSPQELRELLHFAHVRPHIVQSWMDPLHQERPLRALCDQHGVQFQAYSSLGTQHRARVNPVLNHPIIKALSRSTGRSEAQVVLRWVLQHGVAIIPSSMRQHHIEANLRLVDFELSSDDMAQIDALDGTDPSLAVPSPPPMGCANEHPSCESWAAAGECENNPDYMRQACAGSCGTCSERKIEL